MIFPTADLKSVVGKQSKSVAFLNEQQATFLMTMLKNSDYIIDFKFALVKQFFAMREKLEPKVGNINIYEINGRIGGLTSANQKYLAKIESLESQIEELKQMNPFQITEISPAEFFSTNEIFMNDILDALGKKMNDQLSMILNSAMINAKANFRGSLETNIMSIKRNMK